MSIEIFRQRVVGELTKRREGLVERITKHRFVQSSLTQTGAFMPHVGADQVGLAVIEANAEIRGIDMAIEQVQTTFRLMTSPPQEPGEESKGAQPDSKEPIY